LPGYSGKDKGILRGQHVSSPSEYKGLHLFDFDTLIRANFYTTHATNALSGLIGVGLAVGPHLINLNRADVYAFSTAGAAIHVDVD
jgi:hypothetical protein